MQVTVLGAGSWGTAIAVLLARNGHRVRLLGRASEGLEDLAVRRENRRYLPGFALPDGIEIGDLAHTMPRGDLAVVAVPSAAVSDVVNGLGGHDVVAVASKGLAPGEPRPLTEVVQRHCPSVGVVALSGPNLAQEIARGVPTLAVSASQDEGAALLVRDAFHCPTYRVYVSDDVTGVEIAGALKNVMAIAAGASDGLGYGDNTKGALLARGLNEMARIGLAMGARLETFMGVAGVGDLFATANSRLSRNYRVGLGLGQGRGLEEILAEIGQVAEGVPTCAAALELARAHGLEAPICEVVHGMATDRFDARSAVSRLMERTPKREGLAGAECPA
jgi:glycerol-3-phosphate dehydrogenase (NAD(P)+)